MRTKRNLIPKIGSFALIFSLILSSGCYTTEKTEDNLIPEEDGMSVIKLYLTDSPIKKPEISKVFVQIKSIWAEHAEDGWLSIADFGEAGKTYDLMELQNGNKAELGGFPIPFGRYKRLRMILGAENEIEVDEGDGPVTRPLKTYKNSDREVKIEYNFIIADSGVHALIFDFDAKKSVKIVRGMMCEILNQFENFTGINKSDQSSHGQDRRHRERCRQGKKHQNNCSDEKETCYFLEPCIKIVDSPSLSISQGAPALTLPEGVPDAFTVTKSALLPPPRVNLEYVPIGNVYNIELDVNRIEGLDPDTDSGGIVQFPKGSFAEIHYRYDKTKLQEAGLAEDFVVWYYREGSWYPVDRVKVDTDNGEVIAYTSHFTPFVLTAMPVGTGNVAKPPVCIINDYPAGISGSGTSVFTVVDANFKYYQDRNYTIIPTGDFADLGFEGALGISTCNGGSPCGPVTSHKQFTGTGYISFAAQRDIDLYLMYDSRGGVDRFDTSEDAPWIAGTGFVNTGKFIETTDAVQYYTVYRKSYAAGDLITLHGNRNGITGPTAIDTNYWLVVKPQGVSSTAPAGSVCTVPDANPPAPVENLTAYSGQNTIILQWSNPADDDFAGVVIRRSTVTPPALVAEGEEPTGVVIHPEVYRDEGLSLGTTYYYTVFALDRDQNISAGRTVIMSTALDLDGDGLSDVYENTVTYDTGGKTDFANPDSDGDGIDDGTEVANGTDPTNGDASAPVISTFALTSGDPTTFPVIEFTLEGNDNTGITGWLITESADPPLSTSLGWQAAKPSEKELFASGSYTYYAWARDAAGNVSLPVTPLTVTLDGINIPKYAYTLNTGSSVIDISGIDKITGQLSDITSVDNNVSPREIHIHPGGRWAYVENSSTIVKYDINSATGELVPVNTVSPGIPITGTRMGPSGEYFYVYNTQQVRVYTINNVNGDLQYVNQADLGGNTSIASVFLVPTDAGGALIPVTTSTQVYDQGLHNQCVENCCTDQTIFGPVNMCVVGAYWSWELALLRFLNCRDNICPPQSYRTEYSNYLRLYDFMPFYSQKQSIDAPGIRGARGIVSPYGDFAYLIQDESDTILSYSVDLSGSSIQNIGSTSIGSNPLEFQIDPGQKFLYLNYSGSNIISIYAIDPSTGQLGLIADQAVDNVPGSIRLDPTGRILFSLDSQGKTVASYRVNFDGTLSLADYRTTVRSPKKMAILEYHGGNDPPVAKITTYDKTRYFDGSDFKETFKHFVEVGQGIDFFTYGSLDPDAAKCGADPNSYQHSIRLISKPAASAMTQADIDIWETAMKSPPYEMMYFYAPGKWGKFYPDVPGEYEFEYRLTDDPGSCEDIAKTSSVRIVITAVNQMRTLSEYIITGDPPGAVPAGYAVLGYDWVKYYDLAGSGYSYDRIYKYKKRKYYRAKMDSHHHACSLWFCEDHIDAECTSPYENSEQEAVNYCREYLPDTFNSGFFSWSYRHNHIIWKNEYYHTSWYWWE